MTRRTWREKLESQKDRKTVPIPPRMSRQWGEGTLLIPKPLDIAAAIRRIPAGRVLTMGQLRTDLARQFGATTTCPLCTGMFVRIAAEASEEAAAPGEEPKTPYWRVVRDDGGLNDKLPGGVEAQARRLRQEGHRISAASGTKPKVLLSTK
jgi:alkylated DNA nucleotide flippase Atl1